MLYKIITRKYGTKPFFCYSSLKKLPEMLTIDVNAFPFPIQPDISIDLQIFLYKGGLSALKERGEKREGEDGLARDWYMLGRGGVAGKGGNIAIHNIKEPTMIKTF